MNLLQKLEKKRPISIQSIVDDPNATSSSPKLIAELQSILNNPEAGTLELIRAIKTDQGLASHVIKTSNSGYYAMDEKISDLLSAINTIGSKEVYKIVAKEVTNSIVKNKVNVYGYNEKDIWNGSLAGALIMERLAKLTDSDPNVAYTIGLFHVISWTAIGNTREFPQEEILELVNNKGLNLLEAEQKVLGFNHVELGSELLRNWGFIEAVHDPVRYQLDPKGKTKLKLFTLNMNLTHSLKNKMGISLYKDRMPIEQTENLAKKLGIANEDMDNLIEEVREELEKTIQ